MSCSKCNKQKVSVSLIREAVTIVGNIAEGWANTIIKNKTTETIAKDRLKICFSCDKRIRIIKRNQSKYNYKCSECGCIIEAKVRATDEHCDLQKW